MALELHQLTREYVWWEITTSNDLTGSLVEVAFTDEVSIPAELDWESATLVDVNGTWFVQRLVSGTGNGGDTTLAVGDHQAWVRIDDTPERPVRKAGIVTIL